MKFLRTPSGELVVDGANARMRRLLQEINRTDDRKRLRLLNRAWWREFFKCDAATWSKPKQICENDKCASVTDIGSVTGSTLGEMSREAP
jgi:hypothetical protein